MVISQVIGITTPTGSVHKIIQEKYTSFTMNLNVFENFPTAGTPSCLSKATNVCPGVSYGRDLRGLDATSENSSASEASTITLTCSRQITLQNDIQVKLKCKKILQEKFNYILQQLFRNSVGAVVLEHDMTLKNVLDNINCIFCFSFCKLHWRRWLVIHEKKRGLA